MKLNPVLQEFGDYPMATIRQRALDREDAGLDVIDFSIGDPREPTPGFIADALRDAVPEVSQYPTTSGLAGLRAAVAEYVQRRFGITVDPETQVIPTSGAKEAIFSTPLAFIDSDAGDIAVVPSPGYPVYERGSLFAGAEVHNVVLGNDFVLRESDISRDTWKRARLVWTCTPHNPSGSVTADRDLRALYERCSVEGAMLLSDECYSDIYDDDAYPGGPASVLQVADEGIRGALVFFSLSKRSGMTGYRSGAIVGDEEAVAALKSLRSTTGTASPDFVQAAAIAAWSDDEHAKQRRALFTAKRLILKRAFDELGMDVVASRAGLYLWVRVADDLAVTERLLNAGIVVTPGRFFGEGGENHIRLALVPTLGECEEDADALRSVLA